MESREVFHVAWSGGALVRPFSPYASSVTVSPVNASVYGALRNGAKSSRSIFEEQ